MPATLRSFRNIPQPTPAKFLAAHPGCWIQYYDDSNARDPTRALAARVFDLDVARRKQQERCAVCFSLQMFGRSRTKEEIGLYRNMGVDVDLFSGPDRRTLSVVEVERRKEEYLTRCLLPFPLKPHWVIETQHGFHVIFRVQPLRTPERIFEAEMLNRRLVLALQGDENACLLTQVLRVPGTFQFKDPARPFLCRLLLDNASGIAPYALDIVRGVLDARAGSSDAGKPSESEQSTPKFGDAKQQTGWQHSLGGVPEGQRNCTAAAIVGAILGRLPEQLWELAGWGGLKEWNLKNEAPLPDRELRAVFRSIARRERSKRIRTSHGHAGKALARITTQLDVQFGWDQRPPRRPPNSLSDKPGQAGSGQFPAGPQ